MNTLKTEDWPETYYVLYIINYKILINYITNVKY